VKIKEIVNLLVTSPTTKVCTLHVILYMSCYINWNVFTGYNFYLPNMSCYINWNVFTFEDAR
jgi:hypothetical protein